MVYSESCGGTCTELGSYVFVSLTPVQQLLHQLEIDVRLLLHQLPPSEHARLLASRRGPGGMGGNWDLRSV